MILVTAASGSIGRYVVRHLTDRGATFKALVRDRSKGELLGCSYVVGNFDEPETIRSALDGVGSVFLNGAVDETMVRQQTDIVDASRAAGVKRIVRVSAAGASPTSTRAINRWHAAIDAHLEGSGIEWALLRPTFFMQNVLSSAHSIRSDGILYGGFRDGRLAAIDCSDIALSGAVLLTEPTNSRRAFVVTGGEALSFADIATKLSARLGKPVVYVDRPVADVVTSMKSRGIAPSVADSFGQMMASFAGGGASAITPCVKDITGCEPRTFDAFLTDNIDRFR